MVYNEEFIVLEEEDVVEEIQEENKDTEEKVQDEEDTSLNEEALLEGSILSEAYVQIKSTNDIDESATKIDSAIENYKNRIASGNYREFKSSDKQALEKAIKDRKFRKVIQNVLISGAGIAGAVLSHTKGTDLVANKLAGKVKEGKMSMGGAMATAGLAGGAMGAVTGGTAAYGATEAINQALIKYRVFKYKGMNVISFIYNNADYQRMTKSTACYAILVRTEDNKVLFQKLKIVPKKVK